jgi:intein-encoded DNA endonuclease-like protein
MMRGKDEAKSANIANGQSSQGKPAVGRKAPPLDIRLQLYGEVRRLRRDALTLKRIVDSIAERYHVSISERTVSNWANGKTTPFNSGHIFFPRASPELAYVIGVKMGDASLNLKAQTYQYRIRLQAVDRDFVEAFNRAISKVLRCPPHRLWKGKTARETHVEYGSYMLYKFLQRALSDLVPFIEHNQECVALFLRGFFDSEGSIAEDGALTVSNSNLDLLGYVRYLLGAYFEIETTGPHLGTEKGSLLRRRGREYRRNTDCYWIYIRKSSLRRFHEKIGLTIARKDIRLKRALQFL